MAPEAQNCAYHPRRKAIARCKQCSKLVCEHCAVPKQNGSICRSCLTGEAVGEASSPGRRQRREAIYRRITRRRLVERAVWTILFALIILAVVGPIVAAFACGYAADYYLDEAQRQDVRSPGRVYQIAHFEFRTFRYEAARDHLLRLLDTYPKSERVPAVMWLLALCYDHLETDLPKLQKTQADQWLERVLQEYPQFAAEVKAADYKAERQRRAEQSRGN